MGVSTLLSGQVIVCTVAPSSGMQHAVHTLHMGFLKAKGKLDQLFKLMKTIQPKRGARQSQKHPQNNNGTDMANGQVVDMLYT